MIPQREGEVPRGAFLQFMHNFYALYLGVTPPSRENEKKVAAVIIGGVIALAMCLFLFARLMLGLMFSR